MQTLTITIPNGPTFTWQSDAEVELPMQPKAAVPTPVATPKAVPTATAPKERAIEVRSTSKPTGRKVNQPKAAKPDAKGLLADIRGLYRAGKFSEAVALTPSSWKQVIQEIARAQERAEGQPTTVVPSTVLPKAAAKKVTRQPKAAKVTAKAKKSAKPKGTKLAGGIEAPAKNATPPSEDALKATAAANATADKAQDVGIDPRLTEILRSTTASKYAAELRKVMNDDLASAYAEIEAMLTSCEAAAQIAASANDRLLTAELDVWVATLEALQLRCLEAVA